MYMLDTNMCIYLIKKRPLSVLRRFEEIEEDELCISVITFAELQYGVEHSSSKKLNQDILDEFVSRLTILVWNEDAAIQYGKIRQYLEKKGTPIGNMDLMIAAHALSQRCTLVTNNMKEFKRIANLNLENWV